MEARGKQDLWKSTQPEVLDSLREQAIIQSAESSNRIEGVVIDEARLRPLLIGGAPPRDRSEEELLGYRKALDLIFAHSHELPISPSTIQELHKLCQGGLIGDAGRWKERNNEIVEILPNGERIVRFIPVPAADVPAAVDRLCCGYRDARTGGKIPDAAAIALFTLDILCIHPFRDGNGRVSRLISLLLLLQAGYEVGRFISLERIVERTKDRYYDTLKTSSQGWHEGTHDALPFLNYFCAVLRDGYGELADRVSLAHAHSAPLSAEIERTILRQRGDFTLRELHRAFPHVSEQLIKKVLYRMKDKQQVVLQGRGKGAVWRVS
jgi:Fic family protein